jgi:hypothetical protein
MRFDRESRSMHKKEIAYDILAILAKHKQGF